MIALVWVGLYIGLIVSQGGGNEDAVVVALFALVVGVAGVDLVRARVSEPADRRWLWTSVGIVGTAGVLAILSIGLPLLIAAGLGASALTTSH